MNSSPTDPNDLPDSTASISNPPSPEQINEAVEEVSQTPATRLLNRRNSPLFLPAILPDVDVNAETSSAASSEALLHAPVETSPVETPAEASVIEEKIEASVPGAAVGAQPTVPAPISAVPNPLLVEFSPPPDAPPSASVTLELRCEVPGASIRYALDAEDVDENGTLYDPTAKIFLTQSTSVVARAFVDGQGGALAAARFEIAKPGWQKLEPTDQSDPTAHEMQDEARLEGPWRLAAASERGKLHAHRGGWREDAFRHGLAHASDGTYSIVIVSDGAGSAPLSRVGSNILCQAALDFLFAALAQSAPLASDSNELIARDLPLLRGLLVEAARLALQGLREEANRRARPLADFACTLLILVRREWNGQQLCAALQSGDGSIALWNQDETLTLLGEADHGQQSGETRFITSTGMEAELAARVKFSIRPHLRATMVMTDGIADDYFPEVQRFPELFHTLLPLLENAPSPGAALLEWINYEKKGSADDRTLVVSWCVNNSAAGASQNSEIEEHETEGGAMPKTVGSLEESHGDI